MNAPRCSNHKERKVLPKACHTCNRIAIEQELVTKTVGALLAAGYGLQTDQSGEEYQPSNPTTDREEILKHLMEVDDENLLVWHLKPNVMHGWVKFVYGNDGYDVLSDYSTNLEAVLKPVNDYADTMI